MAPESVIAWIKYLLTDEYYSDCPIEDANIVGENLIEITLCKDRKFKEIRDKEGSRFRLTLTRID